MLAEQSLWHYFIHAGPVIKCVMMGLLATSLLSWTFIFQRGRVLKRANVELSVFERRFWSGIELSTLYKELERRGQIGGIERIFQAGFKEFVRLRQQTGMPGSKEVRNAIQRAMRIAHWRELDRLEQHLPLLATVGSTSPYVGLFGTVWGIMAAFQALGTVQQATISMVAPGISEALVATAMGLVTAIPAVIGYNRYSAMTEQLSQRYEVFQEELTNIIYHNTSIEPDPVT